MRRYRETSNAYEGTAVSLYFVEGKKSRNINRYMHGHMGYIRSYMSQRGVRLNAFEAISTALFGRRSIKNLLLRQYPTLTKEELDARTAEFRRNSRKNLCSKLYFIIGTSIDKDGNCVADILYEDGFDGEKYDYKELLFRFLDEAVCSVIKKECLESNFSLSGIRYRMPDTEEEAGPYAEEWDNREFLCDDLLADSMYKGHSDIISPIHFDSRFNMSLPLYPQITIKLEPLPKALYILFLNHPEGIFLKDIQEYETELKNIYSTISGRKNRSVIERVFKGMTDPMDNLLHRNLSKIRRCFISKLNYEIARHYIPAHNRAKAHNIPIDVRLVEIPDI